MDVSEFYALEEEQNVTFTVQFMTENSHTVEFQATIMGEKVKQKYQVMFEHRLQCEVLSYYVYMCV